MKRLFTILILSVCCLSLLQAQTPKEKDQVIQMDKQMFLNKVFDYTTGATEWSYKGEKPAVIDFYATWCGPCRALAPHIERLANEMDGRIKVLKVDVDKNESLAAAAAIRTIPTLFFIDLKGNIERHIGSLSYGELQKRVERLITS